MKKFKVIITAFVLALLLPVTLVLSGCGATATNEVRGVFFDTELYDDGVAVFEVDYNTETELTYKVNPSSGSGYKPVYQTLVSGINEENRTRFELKDGKIIVTSKDFEEITVQISLNGYKDVCKVRLKEYPDSIFFVDDDGNAVTELEKTICADSYDYIHVYGDFAGTVRELSDEEFSFSVVSSDETIIGIPDTDRLLVYTLKSNPDDCAVTITLMNVSGGVYEGCSSISVNYTVVPNGNTAYILIDGYTHFISDGSEIEISATSLKSALVESGNTYIMSYSYYVISSASGVVDTEINTITSTSASVAIDASSGNIIFSEITSGMSFDLTFWFRVNDGSGGAFTVTVSITLTD